MIAQVTARARDFTIAVPAPTRDLAIALQCARMIRAARNRNRIFHCYLRGRSLFERGDGAQLPMDALSPTSDSPA
jgi:hypothetical protein